jgi:hypothetical protein
MLQTDSSSKMMVNNSLMHGVYRQRSCDNSGKFPHQRMPMRNANQSPNFASNKFNFQRNNISKISTRSLEQNAIPKNFKFVSPQSRFDVNSLPRYTQQCKNSPLYNDRSSGMKYHYHYDTIRHPSTPPPPPPFMAPNSFEEQLLLHTPTSSSSGENFCNSASEYDPILNSVCKHNDQIYYYSHAQNQQNLQQVYHNPNKRNSNIYEYRFYSLELNSLHEFERNTS